MRYGEESRGHAGAFAITTMALAAITLLVLSCGDGAVEPAPPDPPRPTSLTVTPAAAELSALGATARFSALVRDQNGRVMAGASVAWSSSNASVATVDASGLVTAAANGAATITAMSGLASGTAAVTVAQVVGAVAVVPAADTLVVADTVRLFAEATDANGHVMASAQFTWTSSDTLVARVDGGGLVTAVSAGNAEIAATSSGVTGRAAIVVAARAPTTVAVTPDTVVFTAVGQTMRLAAEVRDQIGRPMEGVAVSWSSGGKLVATVDSAGLVTAAGGGETTITANSGDATGAAVVRVMQSAASVTVSPTADTIAPGDTLRLAAEAFDENGNRVADAEFVWATSDDAVVRVDEWGLVTGVGEGRATVTARVGEASATSEITVVNPDRAALEALYHATGGPDWTNSENWLTDAPLGEWYGIDVDERGRVTRISLPRNSLDGVIPPQVGNLTALVDLMLPVNSFSSFGSSIPPVLGNLSNLVRLDLDATFIQGEIPPELGNLSKLEYLRLSNTLLEGEIPPELGNLKELRVLDLVSNRLSGEIPPELGNLSELGRLEVGLNDVEGTVPPELGNLAQLYQLRLTSRKLTGGLPSTLLGLERLRSLDFSRTDGLCAPGTVAFSEWLGRIDYAEGPFCNQADIAVLQSLHGATNGSAWSNSEGWLQGAALERWHGVTADSLGRVTELDLSRNGLVGRLPATLGHLDRMTSLRIGGNALVGSLPASLSRLALTDLHYAETELCVPAIGEFRAWLSRVSSHEGTGKECVLSDREILTAFFETTGGKNWRRNDNWATDASLSEWDGVAVNAEGRVTGISLRFNGLEGRIPPELGNLVELRRLELPLNQLDGSIPPELGKLTRLRVLQLDANALDGTIPPELGNLTALSYLSLRNNQLDGRIPPELGQLANLRYLLLEQNGLSDEIPPELGELADLQYLYLEHNGLSDEIPPELGRLANLLELALRGNRLEGSVPAGLARLGRLRSLDLGRNMLSGPIPPDLGDLPELDVMYLDDNPELSGPLPRSFTSSGITQFVAHGTGLCVPDEPLFRDWLASTDARVRLCSWAEAAAYLTQAVQSREYPVPLVAGEAALLRVFVTSVTETSETLPPVRATFYLQGSEVHVAEIAAGPSTIPTEVREGKLRLSANAEVPGSVIQPGLEMVVEIDPGGTVKPTLGVSKRFPAEGRAEVDVQAVPELNLTLIPFIWSGSNNRATATLVEELHPEHQLFQETNDLLPVRGFEITKHEPVLVDSNNPFDLLNITDQIRTAEGGEGHWMGLLLYDAANSVSVARPRGKASFVQPYDGSTIAHELGHNFSLGHAPCGNVGDVDEMFPHPKGRIGVWGYDPRNGGSLIPPEYPDVMGYCVPSWISDYSFSKALSFRIADEGGPRAASVATRALLVSGRVDADSTLHLDPAFLIETRPVLPSDAGPYELTGWRADGSRLFSLPFDMEEVSHGDGRSAFVFALPTQPSWERELARLVLTGPGGSVELRHGSAPPMAMVRDPQTGHVRAILRDLDAVAPSLGDVTISRGLPEPAQWRR